MSNIASRQWGVLTTAQAKTEGISRLQLSRLADAEVLERISQGIYATPSSIDEHTNLHAVWLALDPKRMAEERLIEPIASGVMSHTSAAFLQGLGDIPEDTPEITVASRKQSRRNIRFPRDLLKGNEVTVSHGLPITTPERTAFDLLRDGHDPTHVVEIAGEALKHELTTYEAATAAREPLAPNFEQPDGASLQEHLLDLVGLSTAALTEQVLSSQLGKALRENWHKEVTQLLEDGLNQVERARENRLQQLPENN